MIEIVKSSEYRDWLRGLKTQIKTGQIKAALSVNSQMIMLYWDLGRQISGKQETAKWGSGFMEQLSKDLREEFPDMTGFSAYNLRFMRIFYKFYPPIWEQVVPELQVPENQQDTISFQVDGRLQYNVNEKVEQVVPKLAMMPWEHHVLLLKKVKDVKEALFYIDETIKNDIRNSKHQ